jgi:hypothetical protein
MYFMISCFPVKIFAIQTKTYGREMNARKTILYSLYALVLIFAAFMMSLDFSRGPTPQIYTTITSQLPVPSNNHGN